MTTTGIIREEVEEEAEEQEEDLGFSAKESGNLRKELEMAATIASRVDKGKTGIFSNYASEIRERMKNAGCSQRFINFVCYLIGQREIDWYGYNEFDIHKVEVTLADGYRVQVTD